MMEKLIEGFAIEPVEEFATVLYIDLLLIDTVKCASSVHLHWRPFLVKNKEKQKVWYEFKRFIIVSSTPFATEHDI